VPHGSEGIAGLVLLERLAPSSRVTTVSFVFSEPQWQTDLPAASVACALAFAFHAVGVSRVEGRVLPTREFDLVRGLGAVPEGVLRESRPVSAGFANEFMWSVLATEWDQLGHRLRNEPVQVEDAQPMADGSAEGDDDRPAWAAALPTLEGSVVTLREIEPADAEVLLDTLDPADIEISIEPAPRSPEDFRRYIAWVRDQRTAGRAAGFAIVPRSTGRAAGLVQVRRTDASGTAAEWGAVLASGHRGTGAAADAVRLMAGFAFERLGVHRLEVRASGIDPRSVRLLPKIGAVREARLRKSFARGDEVTDDDLWVIVKTDWQASRLPAGSR